MRRNESDARWRPSRELEINEPKIKKKLEYDKNLGARNKWSSDFYGDMGIQDKKKGAIMRRMKRHIKSQGMREV